MTTAFEALVELNRLKRLKDTGLPYSDEEKQQAWANSFEVEERENLFLAGRGFNPRLQIKDVVARSQKKSKCLKVAKRIC